MSRRAEYAESWDLTYRVEQLRELIGHDLDLGASLSAELEDILGRLVLRNQRLRILQHPVSADQPPEDLAGLRGALEDLDRELMARLPALLERLRTALA